MSEAIEALAEAWASLDGKLEEFHAGRGGEDTESHYHGYLSDAAELAKRLERRGYVIVRAPRGPRLRTRLVNGCRPSSSVADTAERAGQQLARVCRARHKPPMCCRNDWRRVQRLLDDDWLPHDGPLRPRRYGH
jgi:hypothetical protein